MTIELKILIYWVVLTAILYVAAKIHHAIDGYPLRWEYFVEDSFLGAVYLLSKWGGIIGWVGYGFVKVTIWWFK